MLTHRQVMDASQDASLVAADRADNRKNNTAIPKRHGVEACISATKAQLSGLRFGAIILVTPKKSWLLAKSGGN
jgi:hypothetical protein